MKPVVPAVRLFLAIWIASALCVFGQSYTKDFSTLGNQNPLSDGGNWINGGTTGLDWHDMKVASGIAQGTGASGFNDDTAILSGSWGTNQIAKAIVHVPNQITTSRELELRLNTSITAHNINGYELLFSAKTSGQYDCIVRWNGGFGSFTGLVTPTCNTGAGTVLHENDEILAIRHHTNIWMYINGVVVVQTNDATFFGGAPGIGGDENDTTGNGFKSFSALAWNSGTRWYVRRGGNDSNSGLITNMPGGPFASYAHAAAVAQAGDIIDVDIPWYVDNAASGANDGTSWANAWTNVNAVNYASIHSGDTLYISGGPAGGTNTYYGQLSDQSGSPNDATQANPIIVKRGIDAGHNGDVSIVGGVFLGRNYWQIDGSKGGALPATAFDLRTMVPANCGIHVWQTNGSHAVQLFGTGAHIQWVEIQQSNGSDNAGILWGTSPTRPAGNGSGIAYCWIHNINGFGIRAELSDFVVDNFGQFSVHHNLIQWVADNFMQVSRDVDFYCHMMEWTKYPTQGHPDSVQEIDRFSRVWGNVSHDNEGAAFYVEANSALSHDIYRYNNLDYWTTNTAFEVGPDITGHDGDAVGNPVGNPVDWAQCTLSNIWIFGNTSYAAGKDANHIPKAFAWNGGLRTNTAIFKMGFLNNAVIQVAPWDGNAPFQFSTNHDYFNGANGFSYNESEVAVNHNNISGGSGNGKGIYFGNKSHGWLQSQFYGYTNFAQMALDYPQYSSNNNVTAKYASLAQYDFRPQVGDTALVKMGTNLTSFLASVAPYSTNDILGNPRGASWAIGAFEPPPGFYVAITGNDTNIGTWAAPWRTVQHGANVATNGQTVYVTPGAYEEDVTTVGPGVTFKGYPENDPSQPVLVNTFSLRHTNTTIAGLTFHKWINNNSAIYVYPPSGGNNGSGATITNNTLRDGVGIISSNASFFSSATQGSNYIYCSQFIEGGDFNNAGFKAGMGIYLGSYSLRFYTNCGAQSPVDSSFYRVDHISADGHYLYVTNRFQSDPGTNYFAWIVAGNNGPKAQLTLAVPIGSSIAASNITFVNNIVSNTWGCQLDFGPSQGTNEVSGNLFTRFHGQYLANPNASNFHFSQNAVIHNKNIFFWADGELSNPALHPGGGQFYDNQCALIIAAQNGQTNNVWENNLFWDDDNEFLETDWNATGGTFVFRYNVFYDLPIQGSLNMNGTRVETNTFIRVGFDERVSSITGMGNTTGNKQIGASWIGNVALNCSGHFNLSQEAPFGLVTNTYANFWASNNISLTAETMGWGKTAGDNVFTNGSGAITTGMLTNNGDPVLVDIYHPLDTNWVFTPGQDPRLAMPGFAPLPNSYIATLGIGALPALPSSSGLLAHFVLKLTVPGWKAPTLTNGADGIAWAALPAYARPDVVRPVPTPEDIGTNGQTTAAGTLDASQSWAAGGTVTNWSWTLQPDNVTVSTNSPYLPYTFTRGPTNTVALTVTAAGVSSTSSNQFRLPSGSGSGGGGGTAPFITVQPSPTTVVAGYPATFTVTAGGDAPLDYYWVFNGGAVGTNGPTYVRLVSNWRDNGLPAQLLVSNAVGTVRTVNAILTVLPGTFYVGTNGLTSNSGLTTGAPWPPYHAQTNAGPSSLLIWNTGTYTNVNLTDQLADQGITNQSLVKWGAKIVGVAGLHGLCSQTTISNVVFDGFEVSTSAIDGIKFNGPNCIARNNWVHGSFGQGISAHNFNGTLIERNLVENNGTDTQHDHGVYASGTNGIVRNNVLRGNKKYQLQLYDDTGDNTGWQVYQNLMYGGPNGMTVWSYAGYTNRIWGNTIVSPTNDCIVINGGAPWITNNILMCGGSYYPIDTNGTMGSVALVDYNLTSKSIAPSGPHDVIQADLSTIFVSTNSGLYWLKSGSAARGMAATTIFGPVDFFGNSQSSVADVGAFQFSALYAGDIRILDPSPISPDYWGPPIVVGFPKSFGRGSHGRGTH